MKSIHKFLACLLAVAAVLPAASCGSPRGTTSVDENEDVESITYFRNEIESFNTARKQNTPVYAALKSALGGVDVEVVTSGGGSWETVLSKMWFERSLPDMFLTEGPDSPEFYKKLINNGDVIAIDDYVNESTKEEYPHLYEKMRETAYLANNLSYAKGKQWAVPCGWELEKSLYVRQDWIDNLNKKLASCLVGEGVIASESEYNAAAMYETYKYDVPETLIDFYRLARAFTLYDPDGNGKSDTYGYESESNTDMDAWVYVAFGCGWHTEMFDEKTGKYISSEVSDEAMYATAFLNRLLAEGYMNPNSLTNDNGTKQNDFSTGVSGMIFAHNWLNTFVGYMVDSYHISIEEATAKIAMCDPPKGKDGKFGADGGYDDFWRFTCINANRSQKRIKTCLKLLDFMYSPEGLSLFEYGVEGVHSKVEKDSVTGEEKKVNLMGTNKAGFLYSLGAYDSAYQLYSLSWWTGHYYCEYVTNGDIVSERQKRSAQYAYQVDYPYLQTALYVEKIKGLHDYFDETTVGIMNDERGRYWQAYNEEKSEEGYKFNLKTFGWEDIYDMPRAIKTAWNSYVQNYNGERSGTAVYEEYNSYIESGKAVKKNAN